MTVNDIQEVIYLTADLVAQTRIGQLNLSDTFKATIIDATRANEGRYKVKNDNITYEVNGAIDAYKKDEQVIIQQPSNDETRIIVGKANEVDQVRPMVYISPKESIIPSLELKTWDENKSAEVGKSQSSLYNVIYVKGEFCKPNSDEDGGIKITLTDIEKNSITRKFTTKDMLGNYIGKQENWFPQECLFKLTDEQSLDLGTLYSVKWETLGGESARNIEITLGFLSNTYENDTLHIYCDQYPFTFEGPLWEYNGKYYTWNQAHDEGVLRPGFTVGNTVNLTRNFELVYYNTSEEGKYIGFETDEFDQSGAAQLAANFLPEPTVEDNAQYLNLGNTKSLRKSATALNSGTEVEELSLEWDLSKILQYPEKEFELSFAGSVAQANGCKIQFTLESGDNSKELYSSTASEGKNIFSYGFKNTIKHNSNEVVSITKNGEVEEISHLVDIVDGSLKLVLKLTGAETNDIGNPSVSITQASVGLADKLYSLVWLSNQYDGTWKEIIPANGNYLKPQFDLDPRFSQNQIKANLYISSDTPIESNVITFIQTTDAGEALANPAAVEIELEHKENSKDSYTCYDDYGAITESSEAWRNRKVSFSLKGLNGYVVDDKAFLWGKKVYWGIPTNMTMIEIGSNETLEEVESLPTGVPEGYAYYCDKQYMTESVPETIAYSTFNYKIKDQFIPHHNNNTIICIIEDVNGYTYQDTISFGFSESGNYGTDYTLVVREEHGYQAYNKDLEDYNLIAELYNSEGTLIKNSQDDPNDFIWENWPLIFPNGNSGSYGTMPLIVKVSIAVPWNETNIILEKQFPVPYTRDTNYFYQGPNTITYDQTGLNPTFFAGPIKIFDKSKNLEEVSYDNILVRKGKENKALDIPVIKIIKNDQGENIIIPSEIMLSLEEGIYPVLRITDENDNILWAQPLIMQQNRHYYDVLNNWDTNLSIDNDGNRIMAAAYAAGTKDINNKFTGVLMGEKQKFKDDGTIIINGKTTGLFGYNKGIENFALRSNGTFTIGNNNGNINFDNSGLTIKVSKFELYAGALGPDSNSTPTGYYEISPNTMIYVQRMYNSENLRNIWNSYDEKNRSLKPNFYIHSGGSDYGGELILNSKPINNSEDIDQDLTWFFFAGRKGYNNHIGFGVNGFDMVYKKQELKLDTLESRPFPGLGFSIYATGEKTDLTSSAYSGGGLVINAGGFIFRVGDDKNFLSFNKEKYLQIQAQEININSGGDLNINGGYLNINSNGDLEINSGGKLTVRSGGNLRIASGGELNIQSQGNLNINSSGKLNINSGGDLNINSKGKLNIDSEGEIVVKAGGSIKIQSGSTFYVQSQNFKINSDNSVEIKGKITATNLTLTEGATMNAADIKGELSAASIKVNNIKAGTNDEAVKFTNITATNGKIGNWTLLGSSLTSGTGPNINNPSTKPIDSFIGLYTSFPNTQIEVGGKSSRSWRIIVGNKFGVDYDGSLYCSGVSATFNNLTANGNLYLNGKKMYFTTDPTDTRNLYYKTEYGALVFNNTNIFTPAVYAYRGGFNYIYPLGGTGSGFPGSGSTTLTIVGNVKITGTLTYNK